MNERKYLLRIKLLYVEPEIWRRFVVPASITLDRLHDVIQVVMGWNCSHLHEFVIGKKRYTESPEFQDVLECEEYRLGDLIKQKGRVFKYLYDFGDGWEHEITLEDSRYSNPALGCELKCIDGARECPPDDVGGVPGYQRFCDILNNPLDKEYEFMFAWSGGEFDSERFENGVVNYELMKYLCWSRDRLLPWAPWA